MGEVTALKAAREAKVRTEYESRLEWVSVTELQVDQRIQRELSESRVKQIAEMLDPDQLGHPLIAALPLPGGRERLVIVDGQHRIAAVKLALGEDQRILCEVIRGVSLARAAQLFLGRNTGRAPTLLDKFKVSCTADNQESLAIKKIVDDSGFRITNGSQSNAIRGVGSLQKIYRLSPEVLKDVLALVKSAWGITQDAGNGDVLLGIAQVCHRHRKELDAEVLRRKLAALAGGPLGLLGRARTLKQGLGGRVSGCVSRSVVAIYNSGKQTAKLPEWGS